MRAAYRRLAAVGLAAGVGVAVADPPHAQPVRPAFWPAAGGFTPDLDVAVRADAGPAVSLDWTGPAAARLGVPTPYTLTVRNTGGQPARRVTVQVRPPEGATVTDTKPAARAVGDVRLWDVGDLEPGEARPLAVTVTGGRRGDQTCQAWVTVTGTAGMTVTVQEPKLEATIVAPAVVPAGEPFRVWYTVTNTGDCRVAGVTTSRTAPGLREHCRVVVDGELVTICHPGLPLAEPSAADMDPGQAAGFVQGYWADEPGEHVLTVTAGGAGGVQASACRSVRVVAPKLEAALTGPAKLLVGRTGRYTLTVKNAGDLAAEGVVPVLPVPAGLRASAAVDGRLTWALGTIPPGESRQVTFDAVAAATGEQALAADVAGSRKARATAECRTVVDGVPALRCEVADLADPVEAGGETTYEVRLTNTGTKADEGVELVCELPAAIRFGAADGPTGHREVPSDGRVTQTVVFDPIRELAPKTEAVFRVKVRAAAAGDVRFKATVTSKHLTAPVVKEESTRVFAD